MISRRYGNLARKVHKSLIYAAYKNFWIENKPWVKGVAWLFLVFVAMGVIGSRLFPQGMEIIVKIFQDKIGNDVQGWELFGAIVSGNIVASLLAAVGGIFAGLGSLIVVIVNALLAGFVSGFVVQFYPGAVGEKILFLIVSLVPHGIFEIPAILLASATGLRLGVRWIIVELRGGAGGQAFWYDLKNLIKMIPILIILLLIAGLIEVFVSGFFAELVMNKLL